MLQRKGVQERCCLARSSSPRWKGVQAEFRNSERVRHFGFSRANCAPRGADDHRITTGNYFFVRYGMTSPANFAEVYRSSSTRQRPERSTAAQPKRPAMWTLWRLYYSE
jgi:hypothetical protein